MNELTLSRFVAYLFSDGLSPGTIKHYLAAVCQTQVSLGLETYTLMVWPDWNTSSKVLNVYWGISGGTNYLLLLESWIGSRVCGYVVLIPGMLSCFGQPHVCAFLAFCR